MRRILYAIALITGITLLATPRAEVSVDKKIWRKIDSLESIGLYRSALQLVEQVYNKTKGQTDPETEIKALIYRLKYIQELEEDGQAAAIASLESELPDERLVQGALKSSMLAELYYRYFSANRWQISQNPNEDKRADRLLKNWSPERFYQVILDHFDNSLRKGELLSKVSVGSLSELWTGNLADTINKSSLHDVLISRALDFLQNAGEFSLPAFKPSIICQPELFSDPDHFISVVAGSEASGLNPFNRSLRWYGKWLEMTGNSSLVAVDLKRLRYVHEQSCNGFRDSLYESALLKWSGQLGIDSSNSTVYEALALFHLERSHRYQINDPDTQQYSGDRQMTVDYLLRAKEWPETLAGKRSLNLLNSLMKSELSVQSEYYQIPDQAFPVSVEYRNLTRLKYRICRMSPLTYYSDWDGLESAEKINRINRLPDIKDGEIILPDDGRMNLHRANAIIEPLPPGFYLLVFSDKKNDYSPDKLIVTVPLSVTSTTLITFQTQSASRNFYFRDRDQGFPLPGLTVIPWYSLYDQESRRSVWERGGRISSGKEGFLEIPDGGPGRDDPSPRAYRLEIINQGDTLVTQELFYPGYFHSKATKRTSLVLHTDRSLYKPGDEAGFRGVLIDYFGDSMAIHRTDSIEFTLQDPRYQIVSRMVLPVDSFGVFTGSIRLPFKGITGSYLLQTKFGQSSIRMEQYRRPAFRIKFARGSEVFRPGEKIEVSGDVTALSGEPVSGADITAWIDLQPVSGPRRWSPFAGQKIRIATVKTKTDGKGRFSCQWVAVPEGSSPFNDGSRFRYLVQIQATDLTGESHLEETQIDCGKGTTSLSLTVPDRISITDSLTGIIGAVCTDGRALNVPVRFKFSKLQDPGRVWNEPVLPKPDRFTLSSSEWQKRIRWLPYTDEHRPSAWPVTDIAAQADYPNDTITTVALHPEGRWTKGWYKVELIPVDSLLCRSEVKYLYVEDTDLKVIDAEQALLAEIPVEKTKPGQTLELKFASNVKGFMLAGLQMPRGSAVVSWHSIDKRTNKLIWKVTDDWQGGVMIRLIMVRSNRVYEKSLPVSVDWENSKLSLSGFEQLKTVKPGDSVRLNLLIKDENGKPVRASAGITIYDASLDQLSPHNWTQITRPVYTGGFAFQALQSGLSGSYVLLEPAVDWIEVADIEPIGLNWFGLGYYGISNMEASQRKVAMALPEAAVMESPRNLAGQGTGKSVQDDAIAGLTRNEITDEKNEMGSGNIVIRSDFRETAVFNGNLRTDADGVTELSFKVPEVFTEWKIIAAAHDSNLAAGKIELRFTSTKDLMLRTNFPKFVRKGDTLDLSARLGWYGNGAVETSTTLVLSDTSGKILRKYPVANVKLLEGAVVPFFWDFVATGQERLNYLIQASSEGPSDGLTDSIMIYPDEVEMWDAQPFFFSRPGIKQLKVDRKPLEAVFEVTTTPAWQVLQSLPVVNKQERDCSEYWFSRLYLVCLTGSIADKYPAVAMKYLSDSVPGTQKDRYYQVREWMSRDTRAREVAYVMEKLSNLQNQDGTWPWFKGMGIDLFMTQQIISGFGEMKAWGVFDVTNTQRGNYMVTKAIEAMDGWLYRQFREATRIDSTHSRKVQLNPLIINYLYSRSFFPGLTLAPANEIAWLHFLDRIPREWTNHNPGLQALMAITEVHLGRVSNAMPVYNSLRERAKVDEEWGLHWPRKGYGSSWYEWDLWMQSRMIELFAGIEDGHKDLDQMKLFLIHQKRGRDWGNGMVAAWASKSLLFYGTSLTIEPTAVSMSWGNEKYSPLRIKTGSTGATGYYRFEWKKDQEMPTANSMEVSQTGGGVAWGTLYTLNNYQLENLSATDGPLKIKRELLVGADQGSWTIIQKGQAIRLGDIIRIKLTIESDRELSYLEIRDNLGTGLIPVQVLSGYQYHDGLSYYQSREPESLVCYVGQLPKGLSTIEYRAVVEQAGRYFGGYATVTSLYAPEFRAWSDSQRIWSKRQ